MSARPPDWLVAATGGRPGFAPRPRPGRVFIGDLCLVEAAGEARIVLVIDVDQRQDLASIVLTHDDPSVRTDQDLLVDAAELGLPFALSIETDIVAPVPWSGLEDRGIGSLSIDVTPFRVATQTGEIPAAMVDRSGLRLRGPADVRWGWRAAEGAWLEKAARHLEQRAGAEDAAAVAALVEQLWVFVGRSGPELPSAGLVPLLIQAAGTGRRLPVASLDLLTRPGVARSLGVDAWRAITPMLRVA